MESLDEISKSANGKNSFFNHVFNFNNDSKAEMLNIIQYAVLALIPVIILNKGMQKYVPISDDDKNSIEICGEIIIQIVVMFLGMLIIHRIITYIPTYSGEKYAGFSVTNIILAVLVIILSLQTKLGDKVSILVDRLLDLWEGPQDKKKIKNQSNGNVRISQPISQNQPMTNMSMNTPMNAMNTSLNSMGSTAINTLPPPALSQQLPDYNNMYQQDSNPLPGAASPGQESFGPAAANDFVGGAFGSSVNW